MLIPYGTDAPVYHWPYATCGLIATNLVLSVVLPKVAIESYALTLGDGLHPLQWVTHSFLHAGLFHAIGSMLFLWAFGLIVEGKIGSFWFLCCYVLAGMLHGATVQAILWHVVPQTFTLGSEAAVFGIVGMALIWAPLNSITTLWVGRTFFAFFAETYEIPVALYVAMDLVWNIVSLVLRHIGGIWFFGTALGNISGLVWGMILGASLLALKLVDCEGWDLYRVLTQRAGRLEEEKKKTRKRGPQSAILREKFAESSKGRKRKLMNQVEDIPTASMEPVSMSAVDRIQRKIDENQIYDALLIYDKTARIVPSWPSEPEAIGLIKALHAKNLRVESIPLMRDFCRNYPESADRMRLKLGQILIRDKEHPTHGLRVLREISNGSLPANLESIRQLLMTQAEEMLEEGVLELEGEY